MGERIDRPGFAAVPRDADAVRALLARATDADGVAPVSEEGLHALGRAGSAAHREEFREGVLVGYAQVEPRHDEHPAMGELVVDPQWRGLGIGTDLVSEALAAGGVGARVWAHGNLPAAQAIARSLGLVVRRELLQLRRPLGDPLPELVVPQGIALRTYAGPSDDAELLRVNAAAFDWHPEQGRWTHEDVDERTAAPWFEPAGLFLAFAEDQPERLLGFHWTKVPAPDAGQPSLGEVYVVGVDPAAQGRGLGSALTLAGLQYLAERRLDAAELYVEGDNVAALRTYERLGFTRYRADVAYGR